MGCTTGQGAHVVRGHGAGTGQRGLGQGGHSPMLHGLLQLEMHGGHFGTELFNTYRDISGSGGTSDFNMYLDMSGIAGQGGTDARNTYLDMSGRGGHLGHVGHLYLSSSLSSSRRRLHSLSLLPLLLPSLHAQGLVPQREHPLSKPSTGFLKTNQAINAPATNAATIKITRSAPHAINHGTFTFIAYYSLHTCFSLPVVAECALICKLHRTS